jgi:hypothetical protein
VPYEQPEDRRARRLAEVRAQRGTEQRERQIADLEAAKAKPTPRTRSAAAPRRSPATSATFFGYPWPEWFEMRDAGRACLAECAAERQVMTYGELWTAIGDRVGRELGSPHLPLPRLLKDIAEVTIKDGEPNPTALVVQKDGDQEPGAGFFRDAVALHELAASEEPPKGEDWVMSNRQRDYWTKQVVALHEHYATD